MMWLSIIIIVVLLAIITFVSVYGYSNIVALIKQKLGTDSTYIMYGYSYLNGTKASGTVLKTVTNVKHDLACSNLAATETDCVGANWYAGSSTCELLADLLPLSDDGTCSLIIPNASLLKNNVSTWAGSDTVANDGELYCSQVLANKPLAATLCANLPECGAYTQEYDDNNIPMGCIKVASPFTTSLNITTYTGSRTDGVVYNKNLSTDKVNYRWGASLSGTSISQTPSTSLVECASMLTASNGSAATWDASNNGTCTLLQNVTTIQKDNTTQSVTTIVPKGTLLKYSPQWTVLQGATYANNTLITLPGFQNAPKQTLNDAILACGNDSRCQGIITKNGTFYFTSDTSNGISDANCTAYVVPSTWQP